MNTNIDNDIKAVGRITMVPVLLEVICKITGMGFAAVARVTEERWVACEVHDKVNFGLRPGGELKVETTICHEIRQSGREVVINHVEKDPLFATHHTPVMYGLQSYISVPIVHSNGRFFGTLCAIDPKPALLNSPEIIGMFKLYADLISFHLDADEHLSDAEVKVLDDKTATELKELLLAITKEAAPEDPAAARLLTTDKRSLRITTLIVDSTQKIRSLLDSLSA